MKALIIGGERHGEWQDVLDGAQAWVNLRDACTYRIRKAHSAITDAATSRVKEVYIVHLAVHPDLTGPNEPQVVGQLLNLLAMNEFARAHGEQQEVPKDDPQPPGAPLDETANGGPVP
jgi:hypothetical protein